MDDEEKSVLAHLTSAWNEFLSLGGHHSDDVTEFRRAIHSAQAIIACRVAKRVDPSEWSQANYRPLQEAEEAIVELERRVKALERGDDNPWGIKGYDRD